MRWAGVSVCMGQKGIPVAHRMLVSKPGRKK
jgi:hypothetical protein